MRQFIIAYLSIGSFAVCHGVESNQAETNKAIDVAKLTAAAREGNAEAQFSLGKAYWHGAEVAMDRRKAVECYRAAAAQNHPDALAGLGAAYATGQGVEKKDEKAAAEHFRKAADFGSAIGQMNLGMMLISGKTLEKNNEEGHRWVLKAAEQGLVKAQVYAAELLTTGDDGITRDYRRALEWARKAAENEDPKALNLYGVMLRDAVGTDRDPVTAAKLFRRAAEKGHLKGFLNLGSAYFYGNGVEMDKIVGMSWWFAGEQLGDGACRETATRLIAGLNRDDVSEARRLAKDMAREKLPLVLRAGLRK